MLAVDYDAFQILRHDRSIRYIFDAIANRDLILNVIYDRQQALLSSLVVEEGDPVILVVYHTGDSVAICMSGNNYRYQTPVDARDITIKE